MIDKENEMEKKEDPVDNATGQCNINYAHYLELLHEVCRELYKLNIFNLNFIADFSCRYSNDYSFMNTLEGLSEDETRNVIRTKLWWFTRECIDKKKEFK